MVSIHPPTSKSSSPFNNSLVTVPILLFTPLEFFTSALADGFSLEFEWQQVSPSIQDFSQYPDRSQ